LYDTGGQWCKADGSGYNPEKSGEDVGLRKTLFAGVSAGCEGETVYYAWAWFWIPGGHATKGRQEWSGKWRCGESVLSEIVTFAETINGIIPTVGIPD
jgi:hypothetical protein